MLQEEWETSANTLVGTDGGQLSCLALLAQVVCHGREGAVPQICRTALPEAAPASSRAQGQAGGDYAALLGSPAYPDSTPFYSQHKKNFQYFSQFHFSQFSNKLKSHKEG